MKTSEAILCRRSCRTFNGLRLDRLNMENLEKAIDSLSPLFEDTPCPVVKIVDSDQADGRLGTYGFITGARQFLVMAVGHGEREHVQAGFMFEKLLLDATRLGLGSCWLGGTFRWGPFAEAMGECRGLTVEIVSPIGHTTPKMRLAERMMRRAVKADHRKPFARLFRGADPASAIGRALEAVRLAPSSSNSQPWRAEVEYGADTVSVAFTCVTSNRFSAIDMGIAYCHFTGVLAEEHLAWRFDDSRGPLALRFVIDRRTA